MLAAFCGHLDDGKELYELGMSEFLLPSQVVDASIASRPFPQMQCCYYHYKNYILDPTGPRNNDSSRCSPAFLPFFIKDWHSIAEARYGKKSRDGIPSVVAHHVHSFRIGDSSQIR